MAKEDQTGKKDNKKVVDPKKTKKKSPAKGIRVVSDDDNVHPHFRGMDE